MILADTSVWIDHFRVGNVRLSDLLNEGAVFCHPFVIGELACGHLWNATRFYRCSRRYRGRRSPHTERF